ncbi:hypothetical protein QR680_005269 [Steinernema hermaphroditum]|uniref:Uncharacterized protein n=1 Tax=Steinernema hermaphroditum TaxID=289476 RepID=A0AA39HRD9_9BILA|nr:hypothetical protein QR680_005269 [Steinernema hermaphroditum]
MYRHTFGKGTLLGKSAKEMERKIPPGDAKVIEALTRKQPRIPENLEMASSLCTGLAKRSPLDVVDVGGIRRCDRNC